MVSHMRATLNIDDALPPLPIWHGGEMLVDAANRDGLYRAMEEA